MMWVIAILIIILTFGILKDTHVEVYYRYCGSAKLQEEYDVVIPLWMALIIVVLGLLPIANIILFATFIIYYAIHALLSLYFTFIERIVHLKWLK